VQRFYLVMAPEERNWAIVDLVTEDGSKLAREKLG